MKKLKGTLITLVTVAAFGFLSFNCGDKSSSSSDSSNPPSLLPSSSASSDSSSSASSDFAYQTISFGGTTSSPAGLAVRTGSSIALTSIKGKFESTKDGFSSMSQSVTGNFTITATVTSISADFSVSTAHQFRTGLFLSDIASGTAASAPLFAQSAIGILTAGYQPIYAGRLTNGGTVSKAVYGPATVTPGTSLVLKLVRNDVTVTSSVSTDGGATFTDATAITFTSLPNTLTVGVFGASGVKDPGSVITFDNVTIVK